MPRFALLGAACAAVVLGAWQLWPDETSPETSRVAVAISSDRIPAWAEPIPEPLSPPVSEPRPAPAAIPEPVPVKEPGERRDFELEAGQTLVGALQSQGLSRQQAGLLALALDDVFEARKLRAGQAFDLTVTRDGEEPRIQSLVFRAALDREIVVEQGPNGFTAEARAVDHVRKVEARTVIVSGSLAAAAADAGVPQEPILEIMQQLSHEVDFNKELRTGDRIDLTFERFVYPEEGVESIGGLLSARLYLGDRDPIEIYRYKTADGVISFYDKQGTSIETELARTPVVGGYLTSNYGPREHPVLKVLRMHKGMDFAAPKGSAVLAVRSGRVIKARRNGSFGKYIRLDHGNGLETAYAHLSDYGDGVKEGSRVKQGDVIGFVGESGLATSPNLHYEVLRNGRQVDPRAVSLPPRLMLQGGELAQFQKLQQELQTLFSDQDNRPEPSRG